MANDLTVAIPKILAQGLMALREFCVMPRLVNTDYSTDAREKGATIDVPIPSAVSVTDVAPAAVAPDPGDAVPTKASINLSYWREAAFYLTDKDIGQAIAGVIPMQASEAVRAIANDVNQKIFGLYTGVYGIVGTPGTTPLGTDVSAITAGRKVLNKQLAPLNPRRCVLDPDAEANALGLRAFQDAAWRGDGSGITEGQIGRKLGFDFFTDQAVPTHSTQAATAGVIALNDSILRPPGTKTLNMDGFSVVPMVGDVFTIAGDTQTYVVTAATALAGTASTVSFLPGTKVNIPAIDANQVVTFKAPHVVNLGFHRDAFALAVRPLQDAAVTQADYGTMMSAVDPISQLALRLEVRREHKRVRWSYDILYGCGIVRPELAVRIAG